MTTTTNSTAQVSLPSDTQVRVVRDFRAPRTLVWDAHTKTELFQRWIGGYPGWTMPVCEMDVRVGGKYRWVWRDTEGKEFGFHGEFREVEAPAKLVSAEFFDPGSFGGGMSTTPTINRTAFAEAERVTTVEVLIAYDSKEARDAALASGMTDGMEVSFARLDTLLEELQQ